MDCVWCDEPLLTGEEDPNVPQLHMHYECSARSVLGSVAHQRGTCSCHGGTGEDDPSLTKREAAKAAFDYFRQR